MPKIEITGIEREYEVVGKVGPFVVQRSGGWLGMEIIRKEIELLKHHARVLAYEYPNCGSSGIRIEDCRSEFHLYIDDLHAMLVELKMLPIYVSGASSGSVLSLLYASHYPEDVKGMCLYSVPTDDISVASWLAKARYFQFVEAAQQMGMEGVVSLAEQLLQSSDPTTKLLNEPYAAAMVHPKNRDRIISFDPTEFAAVMEKWGNWFETDRLWAAGLTDEQIAKVETPTLIVPGLGDIHPVHTAEHLHRLLPQSEYIQPTDLREYLNEIGQESDKDYVLSATPQLMSYFVDFFHRVELGRFKATE